MSAILKSKLIIALVSITLLTLIPLFESNFNSPVEHVPYRQLTWNDFQGFAKPFTGWGAGISSTVYVDYDSTQERYAAYAAMNNQLSWKKEDWTEPDYLLNHEQYHFNVTEYFARKLDLLIVEEELDSASRIEKLIEVRTDLDVLQDLYDTESDHGVYRSHQRRWEFKIDSMLASFEQDNGYVTDWYSGGSILMPSGYEGFDGIHEEQSTYRGKNKRDYDMHLGLVSFQYNDLGAEEMTDQLTEFYASDSLLMRSFEIDSSQYDYQATVEVFDSVQYETTIHLWVHYRNYLHKVTAAFPDSSATSGYRQIASSFMRSFTVVNTADYWLNRFSDSTSDILQSESTPLSNSGEFDSTISECATFGERRQNGFYSTPIFREDGSLLLPYDILRHPDSLIHEIIILHKGVWYTYEKDKDDVIFYLPEKDVGSESPTINFGYLLKEDSINKCYTFHYQTLEISR